MATKYTVKEVAQTFKRVSQFNLGDMLLNVIGYKGLPYPGGFIPDTPSKYKADGYEYPRRTGFGKDQFRLWFHAPEEGRTGTLVFYANRAGA